MGTLHLLKQEINNTMESEHDFAKWKLIVAAALAAAGLGLGKDSSPNYWVLLVIPFVCAYIDLHLYQYQDRILVLAQFIREYHGSEVVPADDAILQEYESKAHELRAKHFFDLGQYANLAASAMLSVVAPGLAVAYFWKAPGLTTLKFYVAAGVWCLGVMLILFLWFNHRSRLTEFKRKNVVSE